MNLLANGVTEQRRVIEDDASQGSLLRHAILLEQEALRKREKLRERVCAMKMEVENLSRMLELAETGL